ncbi:hypothetical protein RFI_22125 [Reticulomyxa filosa]|uniref:Kelch motif family protein n=1 Tax=Reticulomyxa filosa TaxID=46433 RepID=X6MMZ6_RETFI|nr:hypothetical protein RFI_22125 [Reticulomyxa filosa]|eukprot:ETO15239.1 hypothetical protein RFI_22125 [Reticulomyxa filosa]
MKYVSVWNDILNNYNEWIPFTDNHNHPIIIGRDEHQYYEGVRAVIGGRNNNLLFITYYLQNISIFDLNTFRFIKHDTLPTNDSIWFHCFVSNSENGQGQQMMKINQEINKQNYQMLLFCNNTGLSIEYDEDNNTFQFHQLPVCDDIAPFNCYAYVCINDVILFFGGCSWDEIYFVVVSKSAHKYSIRENKWITFQNALPNPLHYCVAILSEENNHIHIIGGSYETHRKTKVRIWDPLLLSKNEIKYIIEHWIQTLKIKLGWIDDFNKIIFKYR